MSTETNQFVLCNSNFLFRQNMWKISRNLTQMHNSLWYAKGGFFSESVIRFLDLQNSKKNIPKNYLEI